MDEDIRYAVQRLKIRAIVFFCIPLVAGLATGISVMIYWGFFDEDTVIGGVAAFAIAGVIFIPLALLTLRKMKRIENGEIELYPQESETVYDDPVENEEVEAYPQEYERQGRREWTRREKNRILDLAGTAFGGVKRKGCS